MTIENVPAYSAITRHRVAGYLPTSPIAPRAGAKTAEQKKAFCEAITLTGSLSKSSACLSLQPVAWMAQDDVSNSDTIQCR
jgi:hypothetical protein